MYESGQGVEKNQEESIKWLILAAESGVPKIQYDLGIRYFYGYGIEQNYNDADSSGGHVLESYNAFHAVVLEYIENYRAADSSCGHVLGNYNGYRSVEPELPENYNGSDSSGANV